MGEKLIFGKFLGIESSDLPCVCGFRADHLYDGVGAAEFGVEEAGGLSVWERALKSESGGGAEVRILGEWARGVGFRWLSIGDGEGPMGWEPSIPHLTVGLLPFKATNGLVDDRCTRCCFGGCKIRVW